MKAAFLFPGQGSQVVGMGSDVAGVFPAAAGLFEKANEIVGYDLRKICFEGPVERLNWTTVSQPAIFVTSAAILDCVCSNPATADIKPATADIKPATADIKPDVTVGLSLGEYTALYAAGVISFEDALVLVQKRGNAMQAAADASEGAMVSILGLDAEKVNELCVEAAGADLLVAVNFNCPGQIVISGDGEACRRAASLAEKYGAIKAVPLKVAGAFHTKMMAPAADTLQEALQSCEIADPSGVKVIANIDAAYYDDAAQIRQGLVNQLVQPILWQRCMEKLLDEGVESFYEIGPGRALTGLMKRINRKTKVINVSDLESISNLRSQTCVRQHRKAKKYV